MCILIEQPKGHTFSQAWLRDFYSGNADGIGVMYSDKGQLIVKKALPKNADELIQFYQANIQGKHCFIHFRMRTHGDINLEQCHPYEIFGEDTDYPLYLMHNGVLSSGNDADPSKSDTWHYIKDIIRPALQADPTQFMAPWFKTLIEDNIGCTNKFAIVDKYGNSAVFNRGSGVMWGDVWMSNTYAWSASHAGVVPKVTSTWGSYGRGYDDDYYSYGGYGSYTSKPVAVSKFDKLGGATPAEIQDATEYVEEMRLAFKRQMWNRAAGQITAQVMRDYYYMNGFDSSYNILDNILDGAVDEDDVLYFFDRFAANPTTIMEENLYDLYSPTGYEDSQLGAEATVIGVGSEL